MYVLILLHFILYSKVYSQGPMNSDGSYMDRPEECTNGLIPDILELLTLPTLDNELASYCGNLTTAKSCLDKNSMNFLKMGFANQLSTFDTTNFLCSKEGKIGFKEFQNCLTHPNYTKKAYECRQYLPLFNRTNFGESCKGINAMYSCFVNASKICNSEVIVSSILQKTFNKSESLKYFGCTFDYKNWNTQVYLECNYERAGVCFVKNTSVKWNLFYFIDQINILAFTPTQFDKFCNAIDGAYNCVVKDAMCDETIFIIQSYLDMIRAFEHVCKEDRSGFEKLSACFNNNISMFNSCILYPKSCRQYLSLQKCLTDSSNKICGDSSTIDNFFYKSLHRFLKSADDCILISPNISTAANEANERIQPIALYFLFFILKYYA